jgi:hypothetical protein
MLPRHTEACLLQRITKSVKNFSKSQSFNSELEYEVYIASNCWCNISLFSYTAVCGVSDNVCEGNRVSSCED